MLKIRIAEIIKNLSQSITATAISFVLTIIHFAVPVIANSDTPKYADEQRVQIRGYDGHAMEPFISRDGQYLLFNSLNDSKNTSLFYAKKVDGLTFDFQGEVRGANGTPPHLDAVPSADMLGNLYWVSNRDYPAIFENLQTGLWNNGAVQKVHRVMGDIYIHKPGWIIMDAEISADGKVLFYVNARFDGGAIPIESDLAVAHKKGEVFEKDKSSELLFSKINTKALEYAPCMSVNGLLLFFTRMEDKETKIMMSSRESLQEPFGYPNLLTFSGHAVEAPTISFDGKTLYYHKYENKIYKIYAATLNTKVAP